MSELESTIVVIAIVGLAAIVAVAWALLHALGELVASVQRVPPMAGKCPKCGVMLKIGEIGESSSAAPSDKSPDPDAD